MNDFFKRIDELIKLNKTSQKDMCISIGISAQAFTNWKSRDSIPSADAALKIAKYLNTSVEYLLTGIESDEYKIKYDKLMNNLQTLITEH